MTSQVIDNHKHQFTNRRVKTPTVIQMEMAECGAACLSIIMGYYNKYVPIEDIRIACNVNRDGSSAESISTAADFYGLENEGYAFDLEDLEEVSLPAIIYWNFEHFVVLEGFGKNCIYINDPGTGPRRLTYKEFDERYSGVVLCFEKGPNFVASGNPPNIVKGVLDRILSVKESLLFSFIAGICLIVPGLALPAITQVFVDQVLINRSFHWAWGISFALLLVFVTNIFLKYLQENVLYRSYIKLSVVYSCKTLWHMLRLPYSYYTQRLPGEIAHRLAANDTVSKTIARQIMPIGINITLIFIYGFAMLYYDVTIAILGYIVCILNLVILRMIYRTKQDAYARFQAESGKSISYSLGLIEGIENVKEMGVEYKVFPIWAGYYTKVANATQTIGKKDILLGVMPYFFDMLSVLVVLGIGGWRVINGQLTVGMLIALQILMRNLLRPVLNLVNLSEYIQFLKVDMNRLGDIEQYETDPQFDEEGKETLMENKLEGYVKMEDVCFSYGTMSEDILKNIHLEVSPGKSIALVGPTGSGKSTTAKLLAGLYEPKKGMIYLDEKPRNSIANITIRNSLAVVEQKPFIFQGTAKENLTLLDDTIEHNDIVAAAKDACIHDLILGRKGGYDFILEQGGINISGGERQCFEIGRALVKKPTILVLDEATSSLDSEIEAEVIKHIRRRGIALLMIAHRLSTVKTCDEILVIDKGKVVAKGTHEELKEIPGLYQEMIQSEMETI